MQFIESQSNPIIKSVSELHDAKGRKAQQRFLVEGPNAIEEAFKAGLKCLELFCREDSPHWADVLSSQAEESYQLSQRAMTRLCSTESAAPVAGVFSLPPSPDALSLLKNYENESFPPAFLILDGLQDPGNVGTLIRSSLAFGVSALFMTAPSVDPYSPKVIRSSSGLQFRLPVLRVPQSTAALLELIAQQGVQTLLAMGQSEQACSYKDLQFNLDAPIALVMGSEGRGVQLSTEQALRYRQVTIPMQEDVDSLNVGVSGGILLAELAQQRAAFWLRD